MLANPARIRRLVLLFLASLFIVLSWWGVHAAQADLTTRTFKVEGTPMQFMAPKQAGQQPGVLIAHGFSGSKQLMLGYGHVLAHNGYGVLLWDFPGHGANSQSFDKDSLQSSFDLALSTLKQQPEVDPQKLAAIGHSMGSRVVLQGGIDHAEQLDAVVALSPTDAPVTPKLPKNLNLQAGAWEPPFVENAKRLLDQAGGPNPDLSQGKGREIAIIPSVEHATILFSDTSHQETLNWLNQVFGLSSTSPYRDRRMAWYGLHLLGWLAAFFAIPFKASSIATGIGKFPGWGGLLVAPFAGAALLKLMSLFTPIDNLGGLLIGGALGAWMFFSGLAWLTFIRIAKSKETATFPHPTRSDLQTGAISFVMLWIGIGAFAQWVWLPWFLNSARLVLWVAIALACIPWFWASGIVQHQVKLSQRIGWWLGQSLVLVVGLIGTIILLPSLGFLVIILPIFPLLLALFSFVAAKLASPWA
ncbi:MAG: alpha/beta fold hydrolase, partial [Thermosynechococcaceae cyanobacterium]